MALNVLFFLTPDRCPYGETFLLNMLLLTPRREITLQDCVTLGDWGKLIKLVYFGQGLEQRLQR